MIDWPKLEREARERDAVRLVYLPDAIKRLSASIGDCEWNGQPVSDWDYHRLSHWKSMLKDGVLYEPTF